MKHLGRILGWLALALSLFGPAPPAALAAALAGRATGAECGEVHQAARAPEMDPDPAAQRLHQRLGMPLWLLRLAGLTPEQAVGDKMARLFGLAARISGFCLTAVCGPVLLCAGLLARWRFRGKGLLEPLLLAPLFLPPAVTGSALMLWFGRHSAAGGTAVGWPIVLALTTLMALPLLIRPLRLMLELLATARTRSALTLVSGASWGGLGLSVVLPTFLASLLLAFARAVGELGATLAVTALVAEQGRGATLSSALLALMRLPAGAGSALRMIALALLLSLGALLLSEMLLFHLNRFKEAIIADPFAPRWASPPHA